VRVGLAAVPAQAELVVVLSGDTPLIEPETVRRTIAACSDGVGGALVSARLAPPHAYGRVVREGDRVARIVEARDASEDELALDEFNVGLYCFRRTALAAALPRLTSHNAQGELYLTDVLAIARNDGKRVGAHVTDDAMQTEGVNNRVQLATLGAELNRRTLLKHMLEGVTIVDPNTTWIDSTVELARDVTLLPNIQLHGATTVGSGTTIGPDTTLTDMEIGANATIIRTHGSLSVIGDGASVGPFAYLRPNTKLGVKGKIGTFVETKNSTIGDGAKVPHLTYAGDATIGEGANIGAGTIFANYDGVAKHPTHVGKHSFIGSNSVIVAPRTIADGAYLAAGTALTEDVGPGEIAVARGRQRNIKGWVARKRAGTKTAQAAEAALADQADDEQS
jgi:bifunctional UDP-N-acetylglucosamine pyrophosphorylase/glucosamine-1-phosphate N-acetyltransferase